MKDFKNPNKMCNCKHNAIRQVAFSRETQGLIESSCWASPLFKPTCSTQYFHKNSILSSLSLDLMFVKPILLARQIRTGVSREQTRSHACKCLILLRRAKGENGLSILQGLFCRATSHNKPSSAGGALSDKLKSKKSGFKICCSLTFSMLIAPASLRGKLLYHASYSSPLQYLFLAFFPRTSLF